MNTSPFTKFFYYLAILLTLFIIFSPCFLIQYIFHDEMLFLLKGTGKFLTHPHLNLEIAIGRPANAVLLSLYGWFIHSAGDIMITRVICLIELSVVAFFFMSLFQRIFSERIHSFLAAIFIFTLPPFQVFQSWSGNVNWHTGFFLATAAAMLLYKTHRDHLPLTFKQWAGHSILSLLLLLLANAIYPASATFYWATLGLIVLASSSTEIASVKKIIIHFYLTGLASLGLYAVMLKILHRIYPSREGLYDPYHFSSDIPGKFIWFVNEPLFNAFNFQNIFPVKSIAIGSSLLIALTLLVLAKRHADANKDQIPCYRIFVKPLFYFALFVSLFVLSFLPNLLAVKNASFYRCSSALAALVAILFLWSIHQWMNFVPAKFKKITFTVILLILFFYGAHRAYFNVLNYRVIPSKVEFVYIENILSNINLDRYHLIHVIRPNRSFVRERYDEFGMLTTNNLHAIAYFLFCISKKIGREINFDRVEVTTHFIERDKERYPTLPEYFYTVKQIHVFLKGQETELNVTAPVNILHAPSFVINMQGFVESFRMLHHID